MSEEPRADIGPQSAPSPEQGSEGTEAKAPATRAKPKKKPLPEAVPVLVCAATKDRLAAFIELPQSVRVYVTESLMSDLDALLGENRYTIKPSDDVPHPQPRRQWRRDKETESEPASA